MKTIILTTIFLIGFSIAGQSCDCDSARKSIEELVKKSKHVFVGTVKSIEPSNSTTSDIWTYETIEFEIVESLSGQPSKSLRIQNENSSCGLFFDKGKQYLVYVYLDKESGNLRIHQCFSPSPDVAEPDGKAELNRVRKIVGARK